MYNQTYDLGIEWLRKAADNGDLVSEFILAKCMQLGVGLEKNEPLAEAAFARLVPGITMDEIISVLSTSFLTKPFVRGICPVTAGLSEELRNW